MKQQGKEKDSGALTAASRKSGSKAPGTRLGMLEDWRGASSKSGRSRTDATRSAMGANQASSLLARR